MVSQIAGIRIHNYRALADLDLAVGPVSVLFGPNGSGKSTLLDTIWFVRDCAIRGVERASAIRSHGIGILYDGAPYDDQRISIELRTDALHYTVLFDLAAGRIESAPGERLVGVERGDVRLDRAVGSDSAKLYNDIIKDWGTYPLPDPENLSLNLYRSFNPGDEDTATLDRLLHYVRFYQSRSFRLRDLKTKGSESAPDIRLWHQGDNVWSVLRNLHDRRTRDSRFDTIIEFMREAFPTFEDIELEQTGPASVYASFRESNRSRPISASGVSDGHLQLLLILTALFSERPEREAIILLDEPEVSLHPWALAVLAKATQRAAQRWNKQVIVATHSPVLISQYAPEEIIATESRDGRTQLRRVSEIEDIQDLLDSYAAGSLFMSEVIGAQAPHEFSE